MQLNVCFCVLFFVFFTFVNCDEIDKISPVTADGNTVKEINQTELTSTEQQMAVTTYKPLSATTTKTTEKTTKVIEHSSLFRSNVMNISLTNSLFSTSFVQIRMQPHKLPDQLLKLILVKCTFRVVHAAVINQATHHPAIQPLHRSVFLMLVIPSHRAMRYNLVIHLKQAAINHCMDVLRNSKTMLLKIISLNTIVLISMRGAFGDNLKHNFERIFYENYFARSQGRFGDPRRSSSIPFI